MCALPALLFSMVIDWDNGGKHLWHTGVSCGTDELNFTEVHGQEQNEDT